jgi:hypothetical protein
MRSSIYHAHEDNAFGCHGCFDRIEIPHWVNDQFAFVAFRESLEALHEEQGCYEAMAKLEAMSSKGKGVVVRMPIPRLA